MLQAFDYHFHDEEKRNPDQVRNERACELMKYLGVELPYETFVGLKDLSACSEKAEPLIKWSSPNN